MIECLRIRRRDPATLYQYRAKTTELQRGYQLHSRDATIALRYNDELPCKIEAPGQCYTSIVH